MHSIQATWSYFNHNKSHIVKRGVVVCNMTPAVSHERPVHGTNAVTNPEEGIKGDKNMVKNLQKLNQTNRHRTIFGAPRHRVYLS
jgi:hypothetical protein